MGNFVALGLCLLLAIIFSSFLIYLFVVLGCANKTFSKAQAFLKLMRNILKGLNLDSFLLRHWRFLLSFGVLLFAYFVWPTPYKELKPLGFKELPQRQNRFSGNCEIYKNGVWIKRAE